MTILLEALNELKQDLNRIKEGKKPLLSSPKEIDASEKVASKSSLKRDSAGMDKTDESQRNFVNPALLPEDMKLSIDPSLDLVVPEESPYSDKVLQALYNIADLTEMIDGMIAVGR
ncbi:hypothetical protein, partial [Legionella sp.]